MVKVKVTFLGQTIDFDLNRDQPLQQVVDQLCSQLNAPGNRSEYVLQLDSTKQYISAPDLVNPNFALASGALVHLKLSPSVSAQKAVAELRNPLLNKKTIFDLQKTHLQDEAFAQTFLSLNGLFEIVKSVGESQGSTLAYALKALHGAMKYKTGWEPITEIFLTTCLFPNMNSPNINVQKSALEVASLVAQSERLGFIVSDRCIRASSPDNRPYSTIVNALSSTDVGIQANALELVNSLYQTCPDLGSQKMLDDTLEALGMSKSLKKMVKTVQDERLKLQLYIYQALRLRRHLRNKETPYDKMNPYHEQVLMQLWQLTFPEEQLTARVSDQWKKMGFQGTDPATDFRGMGYLGLINLIYFAEVHNDQYRGIITRNIERKEREYPAAVAGINITQMLFELLNVGKPTNYNGPPQKIFRVLFDHAASFEEMYCATFGVLDRMWDEMNASYMEFPKVIAAVKKQIESLLDLNPVSLDTFTRALSKEGGMQQISQEGEDDDTEHPQLKAIKQHIRKETFDLFQAQRLDCLKDGVNVLGIGALKAKEKGKSVYLYMKIDAGLANLMYAFVNSPTETAPAFTNTIPKTSIKAILASKDCPAVSKAKKFEDGDPKRVFGIQTADKEIEVLAHNQTDYTIWIDGLRIWLGQPIQEKDNQDELKSLTDMFVQVRLLDLAGVSLPEEPPQIPPPPNNFEFASENEASTQQSEETPVYN